jgi:HNH endonuclease
MGSPRIDWPVDEMVDWYQAGDTLQQIGDRLGRDFRLVHKVLRKAGVQMRPRGWCNQKGERNVSWNGGRTTDKEGYILIRRPEHPMADSHGYVREHRLIAEKILGRLLLPSEVVHHKNDDPSDNHPDNLMVYETNGLHLADTLRGKVPQWTDEGRARILEAVSRPRIRVAIPYPSESGGDPSPRMSDRRIA